MTLHDAPSPTESVEVPSPAVAVVPEGLTALMTPGGAFPSANLLPPSVILGREVRAAKRLALLIIVAVLAAVALFVVTLSMQQSAADAQKAQAQQALDAALVQKAEYAYVPAAYQAVAAARQELATAMGEEVQVSRLLSGLSALQPPGVSLESMSASVTPASDQTLDAQQTVLPGIGEVAFTGESATMDGIASWLERVRNSPDYSSPVLGEVSNGEGDIYTFQASGSLTEQAMSGRFVEETK